MQNPWKTIQQDNFSEPLKCGTNLQRGSLSRKKLKCLKAIIWVWYVFLLTCSGYHNPLLKTETVCHGIGKKIGRNEIRVQLINKEC